MTPTDSDGRGVRIDVADTDGHFVPFGSTQTFTFSGVWDDAPPQPKPITVKLFPKAVRVCGLHLYAGYYLMTDPVTREHLTGSSVVFKGKGVSWVPASHWRRLTWWLLGAPLWHARVWLGHFIGRDDNQDAM